MKILILSDANSIHTYRWAKSLKDKGIDIEIFSLFKDKNQFSKIVLIAFLLQNLTNDLIYSPDASLFLFVCISYLVSGYYSSISRFSFAKS